MKLITIAMVHELAAEPWWTAAAQSKELPRELKPLVDGTAMTVDVTVERAQELRAWCKRLPGWKTEREPLSFGETRGRPQSARRSGGTPITVRLSAEEHEILQAFATARDESIASVLRECALREARRAQARTDQRAEEPAPSKTGRRGGVRDR